MHNLKKMLYEELKKYEEGGELSVGSLDIVHKITDTIKNIDKIEMLEEEGGQSERRGYSRDGNWMARGSYDDESYEGGGSSYRRRRDRRGRYSREGGGSSYEGGGNYGEGKEYMMEQIEEMMQDAKNPREREILKKCMMEFRNI